MAQKRKKHPKQRAVKSNKSPAAIPVNQQPLPVEGIQWPPIVRSAQTDILAMQVQLEISQWWPANQILGYQLGQLLTVMKHAFQTVPFYKDRLGDIMALAENGFSMKAFRQIPLLTRDDFQDAGNDIITKALPASHGSMFDIITAGSTGQPVQVKGTDVTSIFVSAMSLRYNLWHKRDFTGKTIKFEALEAGKTSVNKGRWAPVVNGGQSIIVNHSLPAEQLLDILIKEDPEYIQIHPSTLKEMLSYSIEKNIKPKNLREVRTISEILYPELRARVAEFWHVKVTDNYSCEEVGIIALQCPEHDHFHVQSENCLVEVLNKDGTPCKAGETGRVVISSLNNFATPLIRYEIGDLAEVGAPCPCGRGLPVLNRIIGRVRNVAILRNGEKRTPAFSSEPILNELPIKHFQLIQKTYDDIEAKLVVKSPLTESEENSLADYFNRTLHHDFRFTFIYLDEIPRGRTGKYEVFKCELQT